jgi:Zn-dependent peptidase ImmA (M78 family)/DNA-binding XRE family transcriptional regulator
VDIKKVVGENLQKIKEDFGVSNQTLADIMGVTRQTVAKYLSGEQILDSAKLFKLSRHFNIPMKDFMVPPSDKRRDEELAFMFRADNPQQNFDRIARNKVNRIFNDYYELLNMYDEVNFSYLPPTYKLKLKDNKLSEVDKKIIQNAAERIRKDFGLDNAVAEDIYSVLENHGIHLVALEFDKTVDALSAYSDEKGAFIFLNDDREIPEERKRFSAVHELGHLIFHRDEYSNDNSALTYSNAREEINEKVAMLFASYFLIPRELLKEYAYRFKGFVTIQTILDLKQQFFVSAEALMMALLDEGYISPQIYGSLRKKLKEQGYMEQEPSPIDYIPKNQKLIHFVRQAYLEERITISKVCEIFNCSLQIARETVKGWYGEYGYPENPGTL